MTLWWTKAKRARNIDDYETWNSGGVVPTLNAMDNSGESFATVLIFYGNRVDDIQVQGQVINTLQARMGTGGNNMPMVASQTVRRLTPTECERLQGFPDGWTAEKWDWKKNAVVPQTDSARYKQMGNAVAVPVVDFLIRRLVEAQ